MCLVKECVKFVVFTFNFIFVLVGAGLITLGTIYKINFTSVTKAIPEPYGNVELIPVLTIIVGCVIFVIAFFGCCGAVRNSPCLLTTYAVILLIIFILQIALGVFAFLEIKNKDDFSKRVDQAVDKLFANYQKDHEVVDVIQNDLKCCGTTGPDFWSKDIPKSCFEDNSKTQFKKGCRKAVYQFLEDAARISGIVILTLAVTEVIGATVSLCLANSIRNELRRGGYY